jgi:hypothetical protein
MDAGDSNYVPGDVAPLTTLEQFNKNRIEEKDVEEAEGMKFNKSYAGFKVGETVNPYTIKELQKKGIKRIHVEKNPVKYEEFLTPQGIGAKAASSEDWIARMAHNRIRSVMQEGATQGWTSSFADPNTSHPISTLIGG